MALTAEETEQLLQEGRELVVRLRREADELEEMANKMEAESA
jgi:hypothetical protein